MNRRVVFGAVAVLALAGGGWVISRGSSPLPKAFEPAELPLSVSETEESWGIGVSITGKSASPITITRVVANDRENIYGCDQRENMNHEPKSDSSGGEVDTAGDFKSSTLDEGGVLNVSFIRYFGCGERIVKLHVETDRGSQDYEFGG